MRDYVHVDVYYDLSETPAVSFVYGGHVISASGFLFYGDHATYISIIPFYGDREISAAGILVAGHVFLMLFASL